MIFVSSELFIISVRKYLCLRFTKFTIILFLNLSLEQMIFSLIFLFLFSLTFKIFLSRYNNYFDYYIIGQISSFQFAFQFFLRQIFMKLDYEKSDEHSKLLIKSMKRFDPRSIAIRFLLFFWKSCRKI